MTCNLTHSGLKFSTEPFCKASYILEDGSFLNLEENKKAIIGCLTRDVTHPDFRSFLTRERVEKPHNAIRVNDGTYIYIFEYAYIDLNEHEPTKQQYASLLKWLDRLVLKTKQQYVHYCVGDKNCEMNIREVLPEDIIKDIKRLYNENKEN